MFPRLEKPEHIIQAVDYWNKTGKALAVAESPRLDDAFKEFGEWLPQSGLRSLSQTNLRRRVNVFVNSVANQRVSGFTHDAVQSYLDKRDVSPLSRDNDRRAVSGFFSWCIDRPRRWISANPCREIRIVQTEKAPPAVLTVDQCEKLLRTAETFKGGKFVPYVAVSLFAGLRPFETSRLTWEAVNLKDKEIRLEGITTKTGRPRVIAICNTLAAWLQAHKGKPFYPSGWFKQFRKVKEAIGYGTATKEKPDLKPWVNDILRHTAISHYFRKTGSYGFTAEQFGNSEAIIKRHYQGRVSSDDTKKFYALIPKKRREEMKREDLRNFSAWGIRRKRRAGGTGWAAVSFGK